MNARAALRAATAADHARVDALFSRYDLSGKEGYRRFLLAQAAAFLPAEQALEEAGAGGLLEDWPQRRRSHLLIADLEALIAPAPEPIPPPLFPDQASVMGGIYVLEGSRLGGAVLKRSIAEGAPRQFLAADQGRGSWRILLEKLDIFLYRSDLIEAAADAAKSVFQRFEAGGLRYLETNQE
ncbi:MAG TPA: biliverdin-producing heme oxygenase [Allosphingosinicella sp.]|uniref:biliverdin-producing heme oxygenase n=1 Tax=Allosphingosinicella sp. TaxID=2823234 RepID=UPI002EDB580F